MPKAAVSSSSRVGTDTRYECNELLLEDSYKDSNVQLKALWHFSFFLSSINLQVLLTSTSLQHLLILISGGLELHYSTMSLPLAPLRNRLPRINNMQVGFSRLSISPRQISTTRNMRALQKEQRASKQPQPHHPQDSGNASYPAFSLDALGLSKNMKVIVLVLISIFGTIETWFYCQAIWRWWKGRQESQQA
ncbi:hypothetical protein FALCPG4_017328 [Fusarium falciforme]